MANSNVKFHFGVHENILTNRRPKTKQLMEQEANVVNRQVYCDKLLFSQQSGTVVALKNGNAYTDGGLQLWLNGKKERLSCLVIYINKDGIIEDFERDLNGQNFFDFTNKLRRMNPLLRLDSTMTSGWIHSDKMAKEIDRLNTRHGMLDVYWYDEKTEEKNQNENI